MHSGCNFCIKNTLLIIIGIIFNKWLSEKAVKFQKEVFNWDSEEHLGNIFYIIGGIAFIIFGI